MKLKPLNQQVIVITGASSGIGLATARAAARKGAKLVLAARSAADLDVIAEEIRAQGGEAVAVETDVSRQEDVAALGQAALDAYGRIDTWVNDAGVGFYAELMEASPEDHRQVFEVNYWGVVYGALEAARRIQGPGVIINIGSVLSDAPMPLQGAYVASKHAVKGFTDTLRIELAHAKRPISVTLIKPSGIDTPFMDHARTYGEKTPKVPPPLYAPEVVADAILHACITPTPQLYVGGAAPVMASIQALSPSLYAWLAKNFMFDVQSKDEPVRNGGARDNLYRGREDGQTTSDTVGGRGRRFSVYTQIAKRPRLAAALALTAAGALAASASRRGTGRPAARFRM